MKSLYAILGLAKSATPDAVRKAYRKKARKAHPDVGGSNEAFAELKLAYDVLIDPVRRERYNKTGSFDASGPDISHSGGLEWIFKALDKTLLAMCQLGQPIDRTDVKAEMTAWLKKTRHDLDKMIQDLDRKAVTWKAVKGRFIAADGDSSIESIIDKTIRVTVEMIQATEKRRDYLDAGLIILGKYIFTYTKRDGWKMCSKAQSDAILGITF